MNSNKAQEKVGLKNTSGKTTTLRSQCSSRRNEIEIDSIEVEIFIKEESTKHLVQIITFQQQETTDIKKSNQGCLGDVLQIQAIVGLQFLHSPAQASLFRHGDHPNYELRLRTWTLSLKRTREFDSIDAAQNAPLHHLQTNTKRRHTTKMMKK